MYILDLAWIRFCARVSRLVTEDTRKHLGLSSHA